MTNNVYTKKTSTKKNPIESILHEDNSQHNETRGFFDSLYPSQKKETKPQQRKEFTIFSYTKDKETRRIPQEIAQLTAEIRKEIDRLKKAQKSLTSQIIEIEKHSINHTTEKPGIYHVRFLEILLSFLRAIISKTNESKTWLSAMHSKKKKRGSLFASRKKKMGTQYSLSQELQTSRNVM